MQLFRLAYHFLLFHLKSFRLHGVHSPFVFALQQNVFDHDGQFSPFPEIEALRQELLLNKKKIPVTDFGAGSRLQTSQTRSIRSLAAVSAKEPRQAQLLFRLVNYFQPQTVLELGTSLGLTTAYLASARRQSQVFTFEGCPAIAAIAANNFRKLKLRNISLIEGNLDETLAPALEKLFSVDFVFFDGNHRYEPTMRYFEACLAKRSEDSVFVFDDIYWSGEMLKAWREICRHPEVTISIDLFHLGLVFFRRKQPKQHFTLVY